MHMPYSGSEDSVSEQYAVRDVPGSTPYASTEYAAAFFLLGNCPKDAINVCIKHMQDYDLAVFIARIRHDRAVLLPWLIETHLMPKARELDDKWLVHWCWWAQGKKEQAIRVIYVSATESTTQLMSNVDVSRIPNKDCDHLDRYPVKMKNITTMLSLWLYCCQT